MSRSTNPFWPSVQFQASPLRRDEEPIYEGGLQSDDADHHAVRFRHEALAAFRQGLEEAGYVIVATTLAPCAPDQLHAHADQVLYRAKHTGKHQIATGLPHVPAQATRPPNDTEAGLHYPSGTPAAWIQ